MLIRYKLSSQNGDKFLQSCAFVNCTLAKSINCITDHTLQVRVVGG